MSNLRQSYPRMLMSHSVDTKMIGRIIGRGSLLIALMFIPAIFISPRPGRAQTSTALFVGSWSSSASGFTFDVACGDYDGDGDLDLVAGNVGQRNQLYRNDGGTLISHPSWLSSETDDTRSVAWGDMDGDGDLDLAVGNSGVSDNQPNRLYRNEGGTLATQAVWSSNETDATESVAWGDMDGDGDLDLAVGNFDNPNRLYRNDGVTSNGMPIFTLAWSSSETDKTRSVAWGDYDHDNDLDLVVGNDRQPNRLYRNDGVTNNGAPIFILIWSSTEEDDTESVAWGDYDNDNDLDIAVGNYGGSNQLYRNDGVMGDGTPIFTLVWSPLEVYNTRSVAWGDYDRDGDLDLTIGNDGQPNRLYRNEGGALTAVWSSPENHFTYGHAWCDIDGDGALDLVLGNFGQPNRVYRNDSVALTATAAWLSAEANESHSVAWGDYDGDGDLDLATGNGLLSPQPNRLYRNDGIAIDGKPIFTLVWSSPETDNTRSVAWGDVDGDGDLDLAVANVGQPNRLYRNDGIADDDTLQFPLAWSSREAESTWSLAWGDVDGDGDLDLAVGNDLRPKRLYRNDGGTLTQDPVWSSADNIWSPGLAWGDYDADGDLDLAAGNRLYCNEGGTLTTSTCWVSAETGSTWSDAWGDYDGDGDLDLAAGNHLAPNRLYCNEGGLLPTNSCWSSNASDFTSSVAWGDYDGDKDLDLVAGNFHTASWLFRNDNRTLTADAVWSFNESGHTLSLAWGDYDSDGDLDLATGQNGQNSLYENPRRRDAPLSNEPPYVFIPRPGDTKDANFFSTPQIIRATNIPITYKLFDSEGDSVPKIFPEFSPNGGGQWFPATPGPGGDGTRNLTASPGGIRHTFMWNAGTDLIKSDNIVFRIRAQPNYRASPILWPAMDGKSPSFRVVAPWYIKVVDDRGNPVRGATVYANGRLIGSTDRAGLLNPGQLPAGTELVALAQQAQQPTSRAAHGGWAYRTYLANLVGDANGTPRPFIVTGPGEQRLVVRRNTPLVLFNLIVSIEWDADAAYTQEISRAMQLASDYLYDLTDGQMAFGQVAIYDNGTHWADADIQILTRNIVQPHAYIGGITSSDTSHVIRVGRGWDGNTGNAGPWDAPDGYHTLAHEFGHYALYLYDEYFAFTFDQSGNLTGTKRAYCTGPENRNPATATTNASIMDYQYTSSELSARGVAGLWSPLCQQTAQWQLNPTANNPNDTGESAWETLARKYADTSNPPHWHFTTPADRGHVLAGPDRLPRESLALPTVTISNPGPAGQPRQLTVYGPNGQSYWGALVALYKQNGQVIDQGFTSSNGRLDVYGASQGDTLRAASADGGLEGRVIVGAGMSLSLHLAPTSGLTTQSPSNPPHMRVIAEPSQDPTKVDLLIFLQNFGPNADPEVTVSALGGMVSYSPPAFSYSPATGTYQGQVSFSATQLGLWRIQARGVVGNRLVRLQSTYRLQRVLNDQVQVIYADDGNLSLHLNPGSLPANDTYAVIMPPGAVPGPLPARLVLVGDTYDISASGALVALEKPALLTLHYDGDLVRQVPAGLGIYRWNPNSATWQAVPGSLDAEHKAIVAPVTTLGTYALLAPPGSWNRWNVFLPIIRR